MYIRWNYFSSRPLFSFLGRGGFGGTGSGKQGCLAFRWNHFLVVSTVLWRLDSEILETSIPAGHYTYQENMYAYKDEASLFAYTKTHVLATECRERNGISSVI